MKSAVIFGASRGIGRQIALTLSENGFRVGVAAKTTESSDKLPGSIHSVAKEIEDKGGTALPIKCNVRSAEEISSAVNQCITRFGSLDLAVYNPGVIMWKKVADTSLKQFDLMYDVNVRGAYVMIQEVLGYFLKRNSGRIVLVSPPIYSRLNGKALIDEDLLRSTGVTDFTKYRCDPHHEPPRMMPLVFPSLEVAQQDAVTFSSKM